MLSKAIWPIVAPTNVLILITATATVWALLQPSKLAACVAFIAACALTIGGFTPVSYWLACPLENRFPRWKSDSRPSLDGIIVLGGDSGQRITELAELSRDFPQARLIYSGPGEKSHVEDLLTRFTRLGGNRERITIETRSRNTFENAVYAKKLIKPHPTECWLLVTAASHMPRAIGCFRRVGFQVEAYPIEYPTRNILCVKTFVGLSSQSLFRLDAAMKEWTGLLVYRLAGKTNELFPAPQ